MTKIELIEAMKDMPDDAKVCIAPKFMEYVYDGDPQEVVLVTCTSPESIILADADLS